jgi:glycosyltransferase involved in cell wall biosynthesis
MKIAIDLTALLPVATGVDTYLKQLVLHLGRVDHHNAYTVFVNFADRRLCDGMLPPNFSVRSFCWRPHLTRLLFQQVGLPAAARALGVDVVHSPSFLMPLYRGTHGHLVTVYDMTFFSLPDSHTALRRSWLFKRMVLSSIRRAHMVSVPSRSTKNEILRLMPDMPPDHVRVIAAGITDEFTPAPTESVRTEIARLGVRWPYILFVGTIEPRKNLRRLLESYRSLIARGDRGEHLVLAGRLGWGYEDVLAQLGSPDLRGKAHLFGYVPQHDLPWLYRGASLFVYPSLQEGFGFPPLEAMACGVPTIASRSTSLAENLEGAAELVPPEDVHGLAAAMRRLLSDDALRAQRTRDGVMRAARFRWEETARQTLSCYQDLAAR